MEISIRGYEDGDAPTLIEVFERSVRVIGPSKYSDMQVAAWLSPSRDARAWNRRILEREAYVAQRGDGRIVGWIEMEANGHLDFLYCAPDAAGKGVADMLYAVLLAGARKLGVTHMTTEASRFAESFFRRQGWQVEKRETVMRSGIGIDRAVMTIDLPV